MHHVDKEDKGTLPIRESAYETRASIFINESGLYALVLSSKLPPNLSESSSWEGILLMNISSLNFSKLIFFA